MKVFRIAATKNLKMESQKQKTVWNTPELMGQFFASFIESYHYTLTDRPLILQVLPSILLVMRAQNLSLMLEAEQDT
jgi:hypothetical protein